MTLTPTRLVQTALDVGIESLRVLIIRDQMISHNQTTTTSGATARRSLFLGITVGRPRHDCCTHYRNRSPHGRRAPGSHLANWDGLLGLEDPPLGCRARPVHRAERRRPDRTADRGPPRTARAGPRR